MGVVWMVSRDIADQTIEVECIEAMVWAEIESTSGGGAAAIGREGKRGIC
jgi:hypothetical protein